MQVELGDFAEARTIAAECLSKAETKELARVKIAAEQVGMFIRLYSGERGSNWSDDAQRVAQEAINADRHRCARRALEQLSPNCFSAPERGAAR